MKKIKIGIMGSAGYTGGELLRLLLNHPHVEIAFAQSRSKSGLPVSTVHTDLMGVTSLKFTDELSLLRDPSLDALFLALPHGEARLLLAEHEIADRVKIIDLSHDFRLHAHSRLGGRIFVYGLPELHREKIRKANAIANPGCFATAIQFALLPLAKERKIRSVSVTGITGATGAGQKLSETTHFSFRANNVQAYKSLTHQHVAEIEENLQTQVSFIPWRGAFTRGIFVSALIDTDLQEGGLNLYRSFYEGHPFISVMDDPIDLKAVVNTNRALIEVNHEGSKLVVHAAIDNLLKGASGQAVQNFNLMMDLPETMGLQLKGTAF